MTQDTITIPESRDIVARPIAYFGDAFGIVRKAEVGRLRNFIKWQVQDWYGTVLEYPEVHQYEWGAYTAGLFDVVGQNVFKGTSLVSAIIYETDAYNIVLDISATEYISYERPMYRLTQSGTSEKQAEQALGSVVQPKLTKYIEETVDVLFQMARGQDFEDGMESDFSRELTSIIRKYGDTAMAEISYLITYDRVNREVASEALRWLGCINDPPTYGWRLWLLEKSLSSASPMVRDGAALGLAFMDDPHAIPYINEAIQQEVCIELREDLQQVLEEIEVADDATSTKADSKV